MQLGTHTKDDPGKFLLSVVERQGNAESFDELGRLEHALQFPSIYSQI